MYELIRRRCSLIFICDGGQDTHGSYADFVTFIQRAGEDFGARIVLEKKGKGPERLVATSEHDNIYPKGAEYAHKGYFVASVEYGTRGKLWPTPQRGLIVYMKTAMIKNLSMSAKGYKGAFPDFPDQSTADQFFDEEQFEAYRELGYRIASTVVEDNRYELGKAFECGKRPDWETEIAPNLIYDELDDRLRLSPKKKTMRRSTAKKAKTV